MDAKKLSRFGDRQKIHRGRSGFMTFCCLDRAHLKAPPFLPNVQFWPERQRVEVAERNAADNATPVSRRLR
jgi:hypothetical protein